MDTQFVVSLEPVLAILFGLLLFVIILIGLWVKLQVDPHNSQDNGQQSAGWCGDCGHAEGQHDEFIGCTITGCECVEGYGNNPDPYSDPKDYIDPDDPADRLFRHLLG